LVAPSLGIICLCGTRKICYCCRGNRAAGGGSLASLPESHLVKSDQNSVPRIIGDIGGTNARFAVAQNGAYGELAHMPVARYASLGEALADYVAKLPSGLRPQQGAFAVAGPVFGDDVALTNLDWSFSIAEMKRNLGFSSLLVVNDFAATAMSVPYLPKQDCFRIGPSCPQVTGPVGVIGPGTGLGVGALVPHRSGRLLLPGEGGHVTLPAVTAEEDRIIAVLRKRWPHVSAERALCGAGLVNLYEALCEIEGRTAESLSPADVTGRAMDGGDATCVAAFAHFCAMLGTVAGNLALTLGATGGIYIAGGILLRFKEAFASSAFRERFEAKGRFEEFLSKVPTFLVLEESPALLGLANVPLDD
jgi:glucokinase